jgi:hypothetical protein
MYTLLVLNVAPDLEEELVDCLLELPEVNGFSTYQIHGHGYGGQMSVAEQVRGRRKRLRVEMIVEVDAVSRILAQVKEVGATGLYWQQPASILGRIERFGLEEE